MMQHEFDFDGYILIDKPEGISSFDVIRKIKKIIKGKIKIGHTGTLDVFATGLLIICIGKNTKKISNFMNLDKEYIVTAKLGELTDSLDLTGTKIKKGRKIDIKIEKLKNAIENFGGKYVQIPPIYSALKYKGQPLYKLARNNKMDKEQLEKIIKAKSRIVNIKNIELLNLSIPFFSIKIRVSKGTYVRSLVNDIAKKIETFATTYKLRRTKIGNFAVEKAIKIDKLINVGDIKVNLFQEEKK